MAQLVWRWSNPCWSTRKSKVRPPKGNGRRPQKRFTEEAQIHGALFQPVSPPCSTLVHTTPKPKPIFFSSSVADVALWLGPYMSISRRMQFVQGPKTPKPKPQQNGKRYRPPKENQSRPKRARRTLQATLRPCVGLGPLHHNACAVSVLLLPALSYCCLLPLCLVFFGVLVWCLV